MKKERSKAALPGLLFFFGAERVHSAGGIVQHLLAAADQIPQIRKLRGHDICHLVDLSGGLIHLDSGLSQMVYPLTLAIGSRSFSFISCISLIRS